ncbi:MAG: YwqJ-related putative deaminase [Actinocatenispora sp.]
MITRDEAERIATQWVNAGEVGGRTWTAEIHEFDLGYVVWRATPPGEVPEIGAPRGIIDRETGETSMWPSLPVESVVAMYREQQATAVRPPRTWDPAEQARRDLHRTQFPCNITHLTFADGRLLRARSMRGDGTPDLHPLVRDYFASRPPNTLERGYDRHAEVAAMSDALHEEDARRSAAGQPPVTLEETRSGLLRGADVVTYRLREPDDPQAGQAGPPSLSSFGLLRHLGFALQPLDPEDAR